MTKTFRIARLELSVLFYSPVAWVLMIIFMMQAGISIMDLLQSRESSQQLDATLQSLTADVFSGNKRLFWSVLKYIYLYVPLLTMGIMSRELNSGSIKLLQSSPVTNIQVILGKYLALLAFGLYFIVVLTGIAFTASRLIDHFDWGIIIAALTGVFMLIAAYSAIGLFVSSLTSYQVVAAISTLAILAGLNFVGEIGKGNPMIREITYWLSLQGRTDNFVNGMISSQDFFYLLIVVFIFVGLTIIRLENIRSIRTPLVKNLQYGLWVGVLLGLGVFSSWPQNRSYLDLSRFEANTLTPSSKEVISNLKKQLHVTNYVNILHPLGRLGTPKWRKFDQKQFEHYIRFIPGLKMDYIYYYDYVPVYADSTINLVEKAQKAAIAHGVEFQDVLGPEEIKKLANLGPEFNSFVRYVHHGEDSVVLRMFLDAEGYPKESEISSALKRLYSPAPLIGFLGGHDERSVHLPGDKSYDKITTNIQGRSAIINTGFDVLELQTHELDSLSNQLTALVIADPYQSYSQEDVKRIKRYIAEGGHILIASEPGKGDLVEGILEDLPVYFGDSQIYSRNKEVESEVVAAGFSDEAIELGFARNKNQIVSLAKATHLVLRDQNNGFKITPILKSQPQSSWKAMPGDSASQNEGDQQAYLMSVLLTKKRQDGQEQKIVLIGDADFMSNQELSRFNLRTVNDTFSLHIFKLFANGEFPVDTSRPSPIDNQILVDSQGLKAIKTFWVIVFPFVLALLGALLLIRRKRK